MRVPSNGKAGGAVRPRHPEGLLEGVLEDFKMIFLPRPPLREVTDAVYERLPPAPYREASKLVALGFGLAVLFYLFSGIGGVIGNLLPFSLSYVFAGMFLAWVYRSDRFEPEPLRLVLLSFTWGVFSGMPAMVANELVGMPLFAALTGMPALAGAFTEEPLKVLGVYWLARHRKYGRELNGPMDGFVYGFSAGMGFEAMENFQYYLSMAGRSLEGAWALLFLRSTAFGFGHGIYSGLACWWLGVARARRGHIVFRDLVVGLVPGTVLHALWNLFAYLGATGFLLNLAMSAGLLALGRKVVSEALRDEMVWGYSAGMAPLETRRYSETGEPLRP